MSDYEPTVSNLPAGSALEINIPVWQSSIDGLAALISWLDGFEAAGHKRIPGHFELVMHFRQVVQAVRVKQDKEL